jgi:hypothetical protein
MSSELARSFADLFATRCNRNVFDAVDELWGLPTERMIAVLIDNGTEEELDSDVRFVASAVGSQR